MSAAAFVMPANAAPPGTIHCTSGTGSGSVYFATGAGGKFTAGMTLSSCADLWNLNRGPNDTYNQAANTTATLKVSGKGIADCSTVTGALSSKLAISWGVIGTLGPTHTVGTGATTFNGAAVTVTGLTIPYGNPATRSNTGIVGSYTLTFTAIPTGLCTTGTTTRFTIANVDLLIY